MKNIVSFSFLLLVFANLSFAQNLQDTILWKKREKIFNKAQFEIFCQTIKHVSENLGMSNVFPIAIYESGKYNISNIYKYLGDKDKVEGGKGNATSLYKALKAAKGKLKTYGKDIAKDLEAIATIITNLKTELKKLSNNYAKGFDSVLLPKLNTILADAVKEAEATKKAEEAEALKKEKDTITRLEKLEAQNSFQYMNSIGIEIAVIAIIIIFQIGCFFYTQAKIKRFKSIFKGISFRVLKFKIPLPILDKPSKEILKDIDEFKENSDGVEIAHIRCMGANKTETHKKIILALNTYLLQNRNTATEYDVFKDIIERNCDIEDESIGILLPVPLYLGLFGTIIGVIIGLSSMAFINTEEFLEDGTISQFMKGVMGAMIASATGLFLTILNTSWFYKEAKVTIEKGKNELYDVIQSSILHISTQDVATNKNNLQTHLDSFSDIFTSNIDTFNKKFDSNLAVSNKEFSSNLVTTLTDFNKKFDSNLLTFTSNINTFNKEFNSNLVTTLTDFNKKFDSNLLTFTSNINTFNKKLDSNLAFFNKEFNSNLLTFTSNIDTFNKKLDSNLVTLSDTISKNYDIIASQQLILKHLEKIGINEFAEMNRRTFQELQKGAKYLEQFFVYMKSFNVFISNTEQLTVQVQKLFDRFEKVENNTGQIVEAILQQITEGNSLMEFVQSHFKEIEKNRNLINNVIDDNKEDVKHTIELNNKFWEDITTKNNDIITKNNDIMNEAIIKLSDSIEKSLRQLQEVSQERIQTIQDIAIKEETKLQENSGNLRELNNKFWEDITTKNSNMITKNNEIMDEAIIKLSDSIEKSLRQLQEVSQERIQAIQDIAIKEEIKLQKNSGNLSKLSFLEDIHKNTLENNKLSKNQNEKIVSSLQNLNRNIEKQMLKQPNKNLWEKVKSLKSLFTSKNYNPTPTNKESTSITSDIKAINTLKQNNKIDSLPKDFKKQIPIFKDIEKVNTSLEQINGKIDSLSKDFKKQIPDFKEDIEKGNTSLEQIKQDQKNLSNKITSFKSSIIESLKEVETSTNSNIKEEFFVYFPNKNGIFKDERLQYTASRTPYKLYIYTESDSKNNDGEFEFVNHKESYNHFIDHFNEVIKPVCDERNIRDQSTSIIRTTQRGKIRKEGNIWRVTKKAIIRYE